MDEKYISVTKFKESLAKLTVEGGTEATRTAIMRTLSEVVPQLLDDEPAADVQPVKHGKDVMKVLQQVSDTCERTRMCMECEFYSKSTGMCVFADMPIFWKHEEIEKALRDGDAE